MSDSERTPTPEPTPENAPPDEEHEFLIPGPSPTSNEGCFRWGASWVLLSLFLLVIVAVMTLACFGLVLIFDLM